MVRGGVILQLFEHLRRTITIRFTLARASSTEFDIRRDSFQFANCVTITWANLH